MVICHFFHVSIRVKLVNELERHETNKKGADKAHNLFDIFEIIVRIGCLIELTSQSYQTTIHTHCLITIVGELVMAICNINYFD